MKTMREKNYAFCEQLCLIISNRVTKLLILLTELQVKSEKTNPYST